MKVLVADDEPTARLLAKQTVENLGHECLVCDGGLQAWHQFQQHSPNVVISDWRMPDLDGLELCTRIRKDESGAYTRFILLTGMAEREALHGVKAGADDFLAKPLNAGELQIRLVAAQRMALLLHRQAAERKSLESMSDHNYQQARVDPLTLLGNRLRLQEDLNLLTPRVKPNLNAFCVALLDLDHFKKYNDVNGHQAGDEALRAVAQMMSDGLRSGDAAYRFGGEEFLIMMYDISADQALRAIERIRWSVEALAIPHVGTPSGRITLSAGVSHTRTRGAQAEISVREADEALYAAKRRGGNRVEPAQQGRERGF